MKSKEAELIPSEVKGKRISEEELSLRDFQLKEDRVISSPQGQPPAREVYKLEKGHHVVHFSQERCEGWSGSSGTEPAETGQRRA